MSEPAIDPSEQALRRMFATAISKRRRELGLSQEALAAITDMSTSYIGLIERGQRNLTVLVASKIAHAYGIKLSEFVALVEKYGVKE
jgi:transcriptional regulator with XRE-family HTH domain